MKLSVANVKYVFEQRMKNLSLAAGLALCLFANINAVSIWKALYTDEQLRTSFADTYARQALRAYEETTTSKDKSGGAAAGHSTAPTAPSTANTKPVDQPAELEQERLAFRGKLGKFLSDVNFGVGWFWRAPERSWKLFAYEFLGSLLTGILVSIGAPYWHDLLQAMSALRERPAKT